jgi:hypothetical protein
MSDWHDEFQSRLHPPTKLVSVGDATVLERTVPAARITNLYGQDIVFGDFSTHKGKFKGKPSQSAATEGVRYVSTEGDVWVRTPPFGEY